MKFKWIIALVCQSVYLGVVIIDALFLSRPDFFQSEAPLSEFRGLYFLINFFLTFFFLLSLVFTMMLHYECWKILPSGYRKTTPEKAVGFLLIPYYNLYWFFISYSCLASGYYRYGQNNNIPEIKNKKGLAIAYAILLIQFLLLYRIPYIPLVSYIPFVRLIFVPRIPFVPLNPFKLNMDLFNTDIFFFSLSLLKIPAYIAGFVIFVLFYRKIVFYATLVSNMHNNNKN
jgi:hypothetical protein